MDDKDIRSDTYTCKNDGVNEGQNAEETTPAELIKPTIKPFESCLSIVYVTQLKRRHRTKQHRYPAAFLDNQERDTKAVSKPSQDSCVPNRIEVIDLNP